MKFYNHINLNLPLFMQAKTPCDNFMKFEKKTNTFCLQVCLTDSKLVLCLRDYCNWCVYEKEYNEDDIGKQIHRKLELIDIYSSLSQNVKSGDEGKSKVKEEGGAHDTVLGTVASNQGTPHYKIERGGKITTYTHVTFRRNNQNVSQIFESNLVLNKIKVMSEVDIIIAKAGNQKQMILQKYEGKIENLAGENLFLKQKLQRIEKQNKTIMERLDKLTQMVIEMQKQKKQEKQLYIEIKKDVQIFKKKMESVKIEPTPFVNKFLLAQNVISYVGQANNFTQIIIGEQIPMDKTYKFKVRILKTTGRNLMIGITDLKTQKNNRSSYSSGSSYAYYGPGGYIYPGSKISGSGFNQNDIVEVSVELSNQKITWYVNGVQNAADCPVAFLNNTYKFMPYIEFYEQSESIEWLGSSCSN